MFRALQRGDEAGLALGGVGSGEAEARGVPEERELGGGGLGVGEVAGGGLALAAGGEVREAFGVALVDPAAADHGGQRAGDDLLLAPAVPADEQDARDEDGD